MLERVSEPDQAAWPVRTREGAVIVAAAAADAAAGVVPRQQGQHRDRRCRQPGLPGIALRLANAEGTRPQCVAEPMLGEHHPLAVEAR